MYKQLGLALPSQFVSACCGMVCYKVHISLLVCSCKLTFQKFQILTSDLKNPFSNQKELKSCHINKVLSLKLFFSSVTVEIFLCYLSDTEHTLGYWVRYISKIMTSLGSYTIVKLMQSHLHKWFIHSLKLENVRFWSRSSNHLFVQ